MSVSLQVTAIVVAAIGLTGSSKALVAEETLPARVSAAKANGTIVVAAGTYKEPLAINKALTLRGEDAETCVLEVTDDAPAVSV
jgi:nitrous oxidase accessory protein NosD